MKKKSHLSQKTKSLEFEENYWGDIYSNLAAMDAVGNAGDHAQYIAATLTVGQVRVTRLADFGFGLGLLLKETARRLKPAYIYGLDPSAFAVGELKKKTWIQKYRHRIEHISVQEFESPPVPFQLGLCCSIIQYIPDSQVETVAHLLASSCRYLYFSVPTKVDYQHMYDHSKFTDPWARVRTKAFYKKKLSPYFIPVGFRLLESKLLVKPDDSYFDEELYRGWA